MNRAGLDALRAELRLATVSSCVFQARQSLRCRCWMAESRRQFANVSRIRLSRNTPRLVRSETRPRKIGRC